MIAFEPLKVQLVTFRLIQLVQLFPDLDGVVTSLCINVILARKDQTRKIVLLLREQEDLRQHFGLLISLINKNCRVFQTCHVRLVAGDVR